MHPYGTHDQQLPRAYLQIRPWPYRHLSRLPQTLE